MGSLVMFRLMRVIDHILNFLHFVFFVGLFWLWKLKCVTRQSLAFYYCSRNFCLDHNSILEIKMQLKKLKVSVLKLLKKIKKIDFKLNNKMNRYETKIILDVCN